MSALKTFVNWLGLGPDESEPYAGHVAGRAPVGVATDPYGAAPADRYAARPAVTPMVPDDNLTLPVTPLSPPIELATAEPQMTAADVVRPQSASASGAVRPVVICPTTFDEAQEIGDQFKQRQPVIVNVQDVDPALRRRIVDFASGLCYALDGQVERVTRAVYLLTPCDVRVSLEERAFTSDS